MNGAGNKDLNTYLKVIRAPTIFSRFEEIYRRHTKFMKMQLEIMILEVGSRLKCEKELDTKQKLQKMFSFELSGM